MFKTYEKVLKSAQKTTRPEISINSKGKLGISRKIFEEYFGKNKYVLLAFDEEKKRIGLKPIPEKQSNSFKVSEVTTKQGYTTRHISAKNFFNHFRINLPIRVVNIYQEEDFIVTDLA